MLIITIILMPLFVVENLEEYLATSIVGFSTSAGGLGLYVLIFVGFLILQFFAINFIDRNSQLLKSKSKIIQHLQKVVFLIQYHVNHKSSVNSCSDVCLGQVFSGLAIFSDNRGAQYCLCSLLYLWISISQVEKRYQAKSRYLAFRFFILIAGRGTINRPSLSILNDVANSQDSYAHFRNNFTT